ncbi:MAG: hypothetical protein GX287_04250, partial [Fusobacteria bacterium]|nr:hypothetical protein [Fusobacteriota bacterium]
EKLQEPIINLDDSIIFKYGEKFISIESYMQDVEIRYTLDGTEPTEESYLYSGEIIIDKNTVLKAKAFAVGYEESNTVTRNYKIRAMKPYASEDKDTYIDSIDIFLSSDDLDSTIYYTLDEDSVNDKSNEFKPTHLIKYS